MLARTTATIAVAALGLASVLVLARSQERQRPLTVPPDPPPLIADLDVLLEHRYFQQLVVRPERLYAYSLRDQEELDRFVNGRPPSPYVTYDPANDPYAKAQDAAKITIPAYLPSLPRQVRLPIPASEGRILITWDAWWGKEFQTERAGMANHKTFMIGGTIFPSGRYLEVRSRYNLSRAVSVASIDVRSYAEVGPNTTGRKTPIGPQLREFEIAPERWTRYWALLDIDAARAWDRFTLWVADEEHDAVQLIDSLEVGNAGGLSEFWIEYNSSGERPSSIPLVGYIRNLVVLRDVNDVGTLLERPLAAAAR